MPVGIYESCPAYPWGGEMDCEHANYFDENNNGVGTTTPVGT